VVKTWDPELFVDQRDQDGQGGAMVQDSDLIPECVAQQLDLVVVLGGDGTVLWTCHIFGNR
jgi:NAD kinase